MLGCVFGICVECARNAARKLLRNGRWVGMLENMRLPYGPPGVSFPQFASRQSSIQCSFTTPPLPSAKVGSIYCPRSSESMVFAFDFEVAVFDHEFVAVRRVRSR